MTVYSVDKQRPGSRLSLTPVASVRGAQEKRALMADHLVPSDPQDAADRTQTASDADQTAADRDQTAADADQAASERDQVASDRDQESADAEQADRAPGADDEVYARSRRGRSKSTLERGMATEARTESARVREAAAHQRDAVAEWRDAAAALRDQMAEFRDGHGNGGPAERFSVVRERAAAQREMAARDRELSAGDRRQAALDRTAAAEEIAGHGIDHLTGTLRRQVGIAAMQREFDRSARAKQRLIAAFIDVDGLKRVNDGDGHAAGDQLLQAVAHCVKEQLRSYDLIARYGGDEFVCTISGHDMQGVRARFGVIAERLASVLPGAAISVGLAERRPEEPLDDLIARADAVLRSLKKARRA